MSQGKGQDARYVPVAHIQGFVHSVAARPSQSTQGFAPRPVVLPAIEIYLTALVMCVGADVKLIQVADSN